MEKEYGVTRLLDPEGRLIKYDFDLATVNYFPIWKSSVSLLRSSMGRKDKKVNSRIKRNNNTIFVDECIKFRSIYCYCYI